MNWRVLLFVPAVALGVLAFRWQTAPGEEAAVAPSPPAPMAVRVLSVAPQPIEVSVSGYGRVEPVRSWEAVSQVDGRVLEAFGGLAEGAIVPAGAVLVRVDPRDYEIARDRAEANLATARAQLAELDAQEVATGQQLALERQIEDVAQSEVDRRRTLVERGSAAEATLEQARRDLITQQRRVLDLRNQLALYPVQRVSAEATVRTREVELEEAERGLANVVITAPFEGRVTVADVSAGEYVRPGDRMLTLAGLEAADVVAEVQPTGISEALRILVPDASLIGDRIALTDPDVARQALGLAGLAPFVRLTEGGRHEWPAEIVRIDGSVDGATGTLGIVVRVDDPARPDPATRRPPLTNGSFVEVVFRARTPLPLIAVPRAALIEDAAGAFVYVAAEGDVLERRPVVPSARVGGRVVIAEGLAEGDRVLLSAPQPAIIGGPLAPVEDGAARAAGAETAGASR